MHICTSCLSIRSLARLENIWGDDHPPPTYILLTYKRVSNCYNFLSDIKGSIAGARLYDMIARYAVFNIFGQIWAKHICSIEREYCTESFQTTIQGSQFQLMFTKYFFKTILCSSSWPPKVFLKPTLKELIQFLFSGGNKLMQLDLMSLTEFYSYVTLK